MKISQRAFVLVIIAICVISLTLGGAFIAVYRSKSNADVVSTPQQLTVPTSTTSLTSDIFEFSQTSNGQTQSLTPIPRDKLSYDGGGGIGDGGLGVPCTPSDHPKGDAQSLQADALDKGTVALSEFETDIKRAFDKLSKNVGFGDVNNAEIIKVLLDRFVDPLTQQKAQAIANIINEIIAFNPGTYSLGAAGSIKLQNGMLQPMLGGHLASKHYSFLSPTLMTPISLNKGISGNFSADVRGNTSGLLANITGSADYVFDITKGNQGKISILTNCSMGGSIGTWDYYQSGKLNMSPVLNIKLTDKNGLSFRAVYKNPRENLLSLQFQRTFGGGHR